MYNLVIIHFHDDIRYRGDIADCLAESILILPDEFQSTEPVSVFRTDLTKATVSKG